MKAELHSAFVFDCDKCGMENLVRGIEADLTTEHALEVAEELLDMRFDTIADIVENHEDDTEIAEAPWIIARTVIAPRWVKCKYCGEQFESELVTVKDTEDLNQ